jgi:hypothetical protein
MSFEELFSKCLRGLYFVGIACGVPVAICLTQFLAYFPYFEKIG